MIKVQLSFNCQLSLLVVEFFIETLLTDDRDLLVDILTVLSKSLNYLLTDRRLQYSSRLMSSDINHYNRFTAFFRDYPGELVPEEDNFRTSWCKGRLTEADTLTIRLGTTPSGLTSAHLHHPPYFFTGRMPFLLPNQQCQSTEGK